MLKDNLIRKLDEFIRKFYKNLLLKGLLYSVILLVVFYLLLSLLEYVGYNSTTIRTILFYLYLLFALIVVSLFVIRPAVKMFRIGKTLSYYDAAKIIGKHFPEVSDKLLNLLQLKNLSEKEDSDLLLASIEQKTRQLSPIPFHKAIDKSKLKRAGIIACCVAVVLLLTALIFPSFLKDTTFRYVNHSTYFEKPAPFGFVLQNKSLTVLQQEDLKVSVKISSKALPEECNITVNGHTFRMRKESKTVFSYLIKQINSDTEFAFSAADVESRPYMIKVKPKPVLVSIEADVIYPAYTGMKQETLSGVNRISLPKGSQIICKMQTRDTKHLFVNCNGKQVKLIPDKRGFAEYGLRAMSDMNVTVRTSNEYTDYSDSVALQIITIEDMYPQIAVIEQKDSILPERILFRGQIKDDYGFDKLEFCVVKHSKGKDDVVYKQSLEVSKTENAQEFYHYYNIEQAGLANGESMEYYFQVWDNDAVNGSKSTKSRIFSLKLLSEEELEEKREQNSEDLKSETENILSSIKDLQKQIEEMNRKLIEKKELSWQDKKQLEELAKKQEELKDKVQEIKDKLRENNVLDEKLSKQEENDILEKQKELEALMNKVLNEDLKEMMEQIRKLANEQVDKQKLNEALNNIKQNNRDIEKQLDRNIEMYKHLEVEKKTDELIEKLKELSEKQKELADKVKHESKDNVSKQQNELQNEFEKQQEKLESIRQELRSMNEVMPKKYPDEFKVKAIRRYEKGESIQSLCQELHISQSTLYHWRREYCSIQTATHTYTPKEFDSITRRLQKAEHKLEIIQLSGYLSKVPLQDRIATLEHLHTEFTKVYSVHELCEALDVARGTFYNHIFRRADRSKYESEQAQLALKVKQIFDDSEQRYGAEKIRTILISNGLHVSKKHISAIMQELGLHSVRTDAKKLYKAQQRKKQDLLNREFRVDHPNHIWVSDITYFKIKGSWLYLCVIIDLFSRKVIAHRISCLIF